MQLNPGEIGVFGHPTFPPGPDSELLIVVASTRLRKVDDNCLHYEAVLFWAEEFQVFLLDENDWLAVRI